MSWRKEFEAEPWRFDFFDVLRRLEAENPDKPRIGDSASTRDEYVALGQDPYMAFPASTISRAEEDARGRMRVMVKFMGLLGPNGPLPAALTEDAYNWSLQRDDSFARFLDIFNNRFLQLFYRVWADARPAAQRDRPDTDRFAAYVGSACGVGTDVFRDADAMPDLEKLAYAGLMGARAKSASRLERLLSGMFGIEATVFQFIGTRLKVSDKDLTRLGKSHATLGDGVLLGATVLSVQDKFRIRLHVPDLEHYCFFLPGGRWCARFVDTVFNFIGEQLAWEVELAMPARHTQSVSLGRFGQLGWTSWMIPPDTGSEPADDVRCDARFEPAALLR